ncbi:MAG: hypothetical protein GY715_14135 [Planctomycetes bacterium]|nr:hypothetical protein [Planctomycetota bacterium]
MKKRLPKFMRLFVPVALATFVLPVPLDGLGLEPSAIAAPVEETEDILVMDDGRELHGKILEEKGDSIVFQLVHKASNIRTRVTYLLEEIAEIHRDVAIAGEAEETTHKPTRRKRRATSRPDEDEPERTYGAHRAHVDADAPSFYIIPMKGQMGTDVHTDVYREMLDDIHATKPDILVIEMDCKDNEDVLYSLIGREEMGRADFDEFRELINLFRDDLREYRQVIWIKDSVGVSSAVALVWDELYMTPEARLAGLVSARDQTGFDAWSDEDVRGKMTAAFMSWVKGFLEYGGYSLELADAMVQPKYSLSGTWKGREVIWSLDTKGEYIVDSSEDHTSNFRAKTAEDLCISDGTAANLDDLALLLGIREYRKLDSEAERIFEDYREDWRRTYANCHTWLQDYNQFMGWASGEDTLPYLGKAKKCLERVVAAMDRYEAVETRLGSDGVRRFSLEIQIEQMKERMRGLRQRGRRGRGGTGPPGGRPGSGR